MKKLLLAVVLGVSFYQGAVVQAQVSYGAGAEATAEDNSAADPDVFETGVLPKGLIVPRVRKVTLDTLSKIYMKVLAIKGRTNAILTSTESENHEISSNRCSGDLLVIKTMLAEMYEHNSTLSTVHFVTGNDAAGMAWGKTAIFGNWQIHDYQLAYQDLCEDGQIDSDDESPEESMWLSLHSLHNAMIDLDRVLVQFLIELTK